MIKIYRGKHDLKTFNIVIYYFEINQKYISARTIKYGCLKQYMSAYLILIFPSTQF